MDTHAGGLILQDNFCHGLFCSNGRQEWLAAET
jgi:hypothetical protein